MMPRTESTSEFQPLEDKEVEYFFASDASAVIEHTNRVIYLEVSRVGYYLINRIIIISRQDSIYLLMQIAVTIFLNPIYTHKLT